MKERGSALVSVILVLLVLTIVGVGIAYFTSMEDRLSGNTRITKAGFYAADAGLRRAEVVLSGLSALSGTCAPVSLNNVLQTGSTPTLTVPGGGYTAIPLDLTGISTAACLTPLGIAQQKFYDVPVPVVGATPVVDRATYSLYVRNNVDDASGDATVDNDGLINVVSVGTVTLTAGTTLTRILEEQLLLTTGGAFGSSQKNLNAGGTGTAQKKSI
ncbi:MAG: hypothetical protein IPL89_09790 [Acidobacteria bacterium]|nr:hypothetical protein [Acidobacteriota bacterium]